MSKQRIDFSADKEDVVEEIIKLTKEKVIPWKEIAYYSERSEYHGFFKGNKKFKLILKVASHGVHWAGASNYSLKVFKSGIFKSDKEIFSDTYHTFYDELYPNRDEESGNKKVGELEMLIEDLFPHGIWMPFEDKEDKYLDDLYLDDLMDIAEMYRDIRNGKKPKSKKANRPEKKLTGILEHAPREGEPKLAGWITVSPYKLKGLFLYPLDMGWDKYVGKKVEVKGKRLKLAPGYTTFWSIKDVKVLDQIGS